MESLIQQFVGYRRVGLKGRNRLNSMHRSARRRGGGTASLAPDQSPLSKENEADTMSNPTGIADLEIGQREVGEQEARLPPGHKTRLYFWRSWPKVSVALIILQALIITVLVLRRKAHDIPDERGVESTEITTRAGPVVEFLVNQNPSELHHLIMVPGHGVTMTESLDGADSKDGDWFLLDYQKNKDVPQALITHMRVGLDELDSDQKALLLFSGGKTRVVAGPKSEGESYYFVADHYDWWGKPDLRARAATEDFARDSFENLLFSICRFKEITGNYPDKITIVGYDFKEERFETLHRAAILFPSESFHYIGLHPEGRFDHAAAETGERESALEPYRVDPYGCAPNGPLEKKRAARNPFHRTPPYTLVCPEMRNLLEWCGPDYFKGGLPWSQ